MTITFGIVVPKFFSWYVRLTAGVSVICYTIFATPIRAYVSPTL